MIIIAQNGVNSIISTICQLWNYEKWLINERDRDKILFLLYLCHLSTILGSLWAILKATKDTLNGYK
jgi:hypothetical protein